MVEDVGGVEAGVVAKLAGDHFEGFGEGLYYCLLFVWELSVGEVVEGGGDFHLWLGMLVSGDRTGRGRGKMVYLAGTAASDDTLVLDGAFYDHNGVV